ncbi:MAG: DMT family transporter [Nitrospinota bacterium]|nr:DMT family transporter [Nitrospinota bacterium]
MTIALFWGLVAGASFGVGDFAIRMGVRNGTPFTGAIIISSTVIAVSGVAAGIHGVADGSLWPAIGWFLLMGLAASGPGRIFFFYSLRRIGVSRATVLIIVTPLFSLLYAMVFLGERPSWHIILGLLFVISGVGAVVMDRSGIRMSPKAVLLGLTPALFLGGTLVFSRLGMQSLPDPTLGNIVTSLGSLLFLLAAQPLIPKQERWGVERRGVAWFGLGGLCYCAAFFGHHTALGSGPVSFVAPITFTSSLFSILIARLFAQDLERVTWRLAAGAFTVFIGVYLVSLSNAG